MNTLLVPMTEATFGRWFEQSQKLQISVFELLDRASHKLEGILPVTQQLPQQEAMQVPAAPSDQPVVVRRVRIKQSPVLAEALTRAKQIPSGDEFSLAQLYPDDWNRIPSPRVFGRVFKNVLERQGIAKHIGNDKNVGMAKYRRL